MYKKGIRYKWFCWIFAGTIMLSSTQLTMLSFQVEDNLWFQYFSDVMGEEEMEDSEIEEETNKRDDNQTRDWELSYHEVGRLSFIHRDLRYHSVFREIFSPPPESEA